MNRQYPCLEISRSRLRLSMEGGHLPLHRPGHQVCGVIKGCSGLPEVGRLFRDCGATQLASSRLEQIVRCRRVGVPGPYMLLRIPMLCELEDVARWCDYSLESERATLDALEEVCARQGVIHKAVIMADLGDLREGFWDQDEMVRVCVHVERDLPHVELAGVGVNLGCYGSIQPTPENLGQLVHIARRVEDAIGRKLEIVSGGATQLLHPGPLGHHAGGHQPPAHRRGYLSGQGFTGGLGHSRHGLSADGLHDPAGPDRGGEGQAHPPGGAHYGGLLLQPAHL
ncbi:MAG: alanine racemase [Oscillospiraceae bacterium]